MKKRMDLNRWLWKQHIIAGLLVLPLMALLSVTGIIYLFKDQYESSVYQEIRHIESAAEPLDYEAQKRIAEQAAGKKLSKMILANNPNHATEFVVGARSAKHSFFIDPTNGEITGDLVQAQTLMHRVRKLHGELLLGQAGTLLVELAASWMFVLLLTGLYIWWPAKRWRLASFFTIRTKLGKRVFFRDLHAVFGFWLSLVLLIILAGGMPWTEVFGSQFKRLQALTNSGYPSTYRGKGLQSKVMGDPLTLDQMVTIAKSKTLSGTVSIGLPKSPKSVFTVSNRSRFLDDQWVIHFDQYSGEVIKSHPWRDVGMLMNFRQIFMRLHQGEYGFWNWLLLLFAALGLTVSTIAAGSSYFLRKRKGKWGLPVVPEQFVVGRFLTVFIILLGIVFPLFGVSLLGIWLWQVIRRSSASKPARQNPSLVHSGK